MTARLFFHLFFVGFCLLGSPVAAVACPPVTALAAPFAPARWTLLQAFDILSPWYSGRYHAGEDWLAADGRTLGQPVRAVANGMVVYSDPAAWGLDGGVVILAHTLPAGRLVTSLYGHVRGDLPPLGACVLLGATLGQVSAARPQPHLHLEIRTVDPHDPLTGYTAYPPSALGWWPPTRFLQEEALRLQPFYVADQPLEASGWAPAHFNATPLLAAFEPPPVILRAVETAQLQGVLTDDFRMLTFAPDGTLLDQAQLSEPAALAAAPDGRLVLYVGETAWAVDGAGQWSRWWTGLPPGGATSALLLAADGRRWLVSAEQPPQLYAYDPRGAVLWQQAQTDSVGVAQLALVDERLVFYTTDGQWRVLDAETGALRAAWQVYSAGAAADWVLEPDGLFHIAAAGRLWALRWALLR